MHSPELRQNGGYGTWEIHCQSAAGNLLLRCWQSQLSNSPDLPRSRITIKLGNYNTIRLLQDMHDCQYDKLWNQLWRKYQL